MSAVAVQFVLIGQVQSETLSLATARRIAAADAVLGASATILLVVGLSRVFFFEKGADYYFSSYAFLAKFAAFLAAAALSFLPTREFLSWRKALKAGQVPAVDPAKLRFIRKVLHGELIAIVIILLCAAIMARGGWV